MHAVPELLHQPSIFCRIQVREIEKLLRQNFRYKRFPKNILNQIKAEKSRIFG
jgi:hypothetical protein